MYVIHGGLRGLPPGKLKLQESVLETIHCILKCDCSIRVSRTFHTNITQRKWVGKGMPPPPQPISPYMHSFIE